MTPDEALKQTFKNGNYFRGPVSELVKRLAYVLEQIEVLAGLPGKMAAHRVRQKQVMVRKFEKAIKERVSWHYAELRRAQDAGFPIAEEFEPKRRTIKVNAHA